MRIGIDAGADIDAVDYDGVGRLSRIVMVGSPMSRKLLVKS